MAGLTVADRGRIYGEAYEARQRDPVVDYANLASVANGRMNKWQRMNQGQQLVYVDDFEGNPRALTPRQVEVYQLARTMIEGEFLTMRAMAQRLGVSPSTVSRAMAKLSAWGILVYIVGRGRWAGLVIIKYVRDGGHLDYLRRLAKDRVRRWKEAADRRLSRLALNVAPYISEEGVRVLGDGSSSTTTKGATLTVQRKWTPEELRSLGII